MPKFVDPISMKSGTTDIPIASTAGLLFGVGTAPSTVAFTFVDTTTLQTLYNKAMPVTAATTASDTFAAYEGLVYFAPTTATQAYNLLMPPFAGAELILKDVGGSSNDKITLTCTAANLIDGVYKTIVLDGAGQYVRLIGLSTTLGWAIAGLNSTALSKTTSVPTFSS
jgi:hypothetical protein